MEGGRVEGEGEENGEGEEGWRPTYGDAVVAGEPDSYKLPYEEAKSCWEDREWGGERGQGEGAGTGYRREVEGSEKGEQGGRRRQRGRRQRREERKKAEKGRV